MTESNSGYRLIACVVKDLTVLDLSLLFCFPKSQDFSFSTSFLACKGGYVEWAPFPIQ